MAAPTKAARKRQTIHRSMTRAGDRREPSRGCSKRRKSHVSSQVRSGGRGRPPNRSRSTETLRAEGGEAWSRFLADPIGYLGGDPASFRAGVLAALGFTVAKGPGDARVAVFTHGLPINIVLSHALGLDSITRFVVDYGSVTRLRHVGDGRYGVRSVNETGHHRWTAWTS